MVGPSIYHEMALGENHSLFHRLALGGKPIAKDIIVVSGVVLFNFVSSS